MRATVRLSIIDMWKEPRPGSKRVSQARLGEDLAVEKVKGRFLWVRSQDAYHGWVERSAVKEGRARYAGTGRVVAVESLFEPVSADSYQLETLLVAPMGSILEVTGRKDNRTRVRLPDGRAGFMRTEELRPACDPFPKEDIESIVERALKLVGTPYLWGGASPWGLDCSGFVQLVYKMGGYQLLRDADQQFEGNGRFVPVNHVRRGDLLFFRGKNSRRVSHVAIHLDRNTMIHASGSRGVVVDSVSTLTELLVGVRRIVTPHVRKQAKAHHDGS